MADRTEQLLRDALHARADQVTEESLDLPPELPHPGHRRWTVFAAAAAMFALATGLAVVLLNVDRDVQPITPPPAPTSEPPACPAGEMCVIQTVDVRGEKLELAAKNVPAAGDDLYGDWVLRAGGHQIADGGRSDGPDLGEAQGLRGRIGAYVRADSLRCFVFNRQPAVCLLDTYDLGDTNDVLGLSRTSSGWFFDGRHPTPFGKESIDVRLGNDGGFLVVAVQHEPGRSSWWAKVWRWGGEELGCTEPVRDEKDLPGWPDVTPRTTALDPANCP